jgi:hypothetical protein
MIMSNATYSRVNDRDVAVVHVRFAGRSFDVPMLHLDLAFGASDAQVKRAVAGQLEIPAARLNDHVVDRHANGNLTLRPEAVYG